MRQVLVLHCAGAQGPRQGSGELAAHLREALGPDYRVRYPLMPNPENPAYEAWKRKLEEELEELDGEALLVGHSLGGSVLLKALAEKPLLRRTAGLFLVAAPFWGEKSGWQADEFDLPADFAARLTAIPYIYLYHSRDDDTVPFAHVALYAARLPHATVRAFDRLGHYFRTGCRQLIEDIRSV